MLAGCSSPDSTPDLLPRTDAEVAAELAVTADDVVTVNAASRRKGDTTVLESKGVLATRVIVPDAALPAGLDPETITATMSSIESPTDGLASVTFHLGPDGTTFRAPVTLEWEGPWTPDAQYMLDARAEDGTPLFDDLAEASAAIAGLTVESTSPTTARYRLPVTHFSSWTVTMRSSFYGTPLNLEAELGDVPTLNVGQKATVPLIAEVDSWLDGAVMCGYAAMRAAPTGITADLDNGTANCLVAEWWSARRISLELGCTAPASGTMYGTLIVLAGFDWITLSAGVDVSKLRQFEEAFVAAAWTIEDGAQSSTVKIPTDRRVFGTLFTAPFEAAVRCVEAPASTTSSSSPAGSSTTASSTTASTASTTSTTAPRSTTTAPRTSTTASPSPSSPTTTPAATTSTTAPPPQVSTTTAPPTTEASTTTTAAPPTTAPTTTEAPTTTAAPTTTTTAAWGEAGTWSHNVTEGCDWNGSGECGWYFTATEGTYRLGPAGYPGARWD